MKAKRIIVGLKIEGNTYKFLSILPSQKDASLFIYQHMKYETSPLMVGTKSLTHIPTKEYLSDIPTKLYPEGSEVHLSLHPNRIYLKRRRKGGTTEHLLKEAEPQKFNKNSWRLICVLTPPPPSHMPVIRETKNGEAILFEWTHAICPQISILEFEKGTDWRDKMSTLEKAEKYHIVETDGIHPTIALQLRKTTSEPYVWAPRCAIFGRILKGKS